MNYSTPSINSVAKIHLVAESQYVVGLIPDPNGCPTFIFDGETGSGVIDVSATFSFTINFNAGNCQGTSTMTAQATFQDGVLVPDCSNAQFDCDFPICLNTSGPTGGELCLTSLTLNGEPQDVDFCVNLNSSEVQEVGGTICDVGLGT